MCLIYVLLHVHIHVYIGEFAWYVLLVGPWVVLGFSVVWRRLVSFYQ